MGVFTTKRLDRAQNPHTKQARKAQGAFVAANFRTSTHACANAYTCCYCCCRCGAVPMIAACLHAGAKVVVLLQVRRSALRPEVDKLLLCHSTHEAQQRAAADTLGHLKPQVAKVQRSLQHHVRRPLGTCSTCARTSITCFVGCRSSCGVSTDLDCEHKTLSKLLQAMACIPASRLVYLPVLWYLPLYVRWHACVREYAAFYMAVHQGPALHTAVIHGDKPKHATALVDSM